MSDALTGTFKNPTKCLCRWEPDRSLNLSPPAYLCAVTYLNEISLQVTLSNQFHSLSLQFSREARLNCPLRRTAEDICIDIFVHVF